MIINYQSYKLPQINKLSCGYKKIRIDLDSIASRIWRVVRA